MFTKSQCGKFLNFLHCVSFEIVVRTTCIYKFRKKAAGASKRTLFKRPPGDAALRSVSPQTGGQIGTVLSYNSICSRADPYLLSALQLYFP